MDTAKKTELEKRIVLGLAAVCAVVFVAGPLRSLKLFPSGGRATHSSAGMSTVKLTKSVGEMLHGEWKKLDAQIESVTTRPVAPQAAAAYTAFDVRDPLKSLLPRPATPTPAGSEAVAEVTVIEPPLPPQLRVEGLLWGGPEPKAVINGRLYGVHDAVDGVEIIAIDRTGVTIEHLGKPVVYSTASMR